MAKVIKAPAELGSPDPAVRRKALLVLAGSARETSHLQIFLAVAQNDKDPAIRMLARQLYQEARKTLGAASPGAEVVDSSGSVNPATLEAILNKGETAAKIEAIRRAVEDGQRAPLSVFRRHLTTQKDPWVQASLLKAVGKLGSSQDIHLIQPFLKHDDLRIQANAIEALEFIGDELSFSLVADKLQSNDPRIRANAIKCLVKFDPDEAMARLERLAEADARPSRESAVYCLGIVDHPRVPEIVAKMVMRERDPGMLERQLKLLSEEGGPESIGPLSYLLDVLQGDLQKRTAMALGQVRSRLVMSADKVERLKADFLAATRASPPPAGSLANPGAAGDATGGGPTLGHEVFSKGKTDEARRAEDELKRHLNKRKAADDPGPPPTLGRQVFEAFRDNPLMALLFAVTGAFLIGSVAVFLQPRPPPPPRPKPPPTKAPPPKPTKKPTAPPKKPDEEVVVKGVIMNIDHRRKTALVRTDDGSVSVLFEREPSDRLKRRVKVELRGHYTGKKIFGAQQMVAKWASEVR